MLLVVLVFRVDLCVFFFRGQFALCLGSLLAKLAEMMRKGAGAAFFSAAVGAFAVRLLLGCFIGFASVLFFVSPLRAMLRWPNPLKPRERFTVFSGRQGPRLASMH